MILSFLGRNTEGIFVDAKREFGDQSVLLITRDGDQLQSPAGVASVPVSQFVPEANERYTLIAHHSCNLEITAHAEK